MWLHGRPPGGVGGGLCGRRGGKGDKRMVGTTVILVRNALSINTTSAYLALQTVQTVHVCMHANLKTSQSKQSCMLTTQCSALTSCTLYIDQDWSSSTVS